MSLGRHRGHFALLALVAALVLSACGGSSSSSSSKSASASSSATTSTKSSTQHAKAKKAKAKAQAAAHHARADAHAAHPPPPKLPKHPQGPNKLPAAELKSLRANPLGAAFSVADTTFTNFVYKPLVSAPAGNKTQQHFTILRAAAASEFVSHSLLASYQQARHHAATADLAARFYSLANQDTALHAELAKGQKPTSQLRSFEQSLTSIAAELKARGIKLFLGGA